MAGSVFETLVGGELYRLMADSGEVPSLYHYRTVGQQEVDFVFEHGGRLHAVECKLSSSAAGDDVRAMRAMMSNVPTARRGKSMLICTTPRLSRLGDVSVLPLFAFNQLRTVDELLEAVG